MNVLLIVGEKSAENYASLLVDSLKHIRPQWKFYSVCSTLLEEKTTKVLDYSSISVIGIREAFSVASRAFAFLKSVKECLVRCNIDLVILMDFPEFNLRVARFAHSLGIKVVYYTIPQIWAWREYRVRYLMDWCDLIVPILPFERVFLTTRGIDKEKVVYLGHPIMDVLESYIGKPNQREEIVLVMPGSRVSELERNAPIMMEAARRIKERYRSYRFVWILPETAEKSECVGVMKERYPFVEVEREPYGFMKRAMFGILKSGTTTLEAALLGLPMVVSYRVTNFSYMIGKLLVRDIGYISLPNLIAGRKIVKELIQNNSTPDNIEREFNAFRERKGIYGSMERNLEFLRYTLGEASVSMRVARLIASLL